jgi:heparanase 1
LQKGITLLLINLDNSTTVEVTVTFNSTWRLHQKHKPHRSHKLHKPHRSHRSHKSHKSKVIQQPQRSTSGITREEYHLTAKDGDLHSQTMLLNGNILTVNSSGDIPSLEPLHVNSSKPIMVAPFSIVFVQMPYVLPACS